MNQFVERWQLPPAFECEHSKTSSTLEGSQRNESCVASRRISQRVVIVWLICAKSRVLIRGDVDTNPLVAGGKVKCVD